MLVSKLSMSFLAPLRSQLLLRPPGIRILPDSEMRQAERPSLNRLCDISDWRVGGALSAIMKDLNEGVYVHRKSWEYALCIYGLEKLGAATPESRALSIGAGSERPLYYFANHVSEMVATDLYDNPGREGTPAMLTTPEAFRPFEYRRDRLTTLAMPGTQLIFPDASFDFAFTLSSIEHFGGKENAAKAVRELYRVLKPHGVACIATELILDGATHPEYFTMNQLRKYLLGAAPFELAGGDLDLRISRSLVRNAINLETEKDLSVSPHIVMKAQGVAWTSVMLFLRKT